MTGVEPCCSNQTVVSSPDSIFQASATSNAFTKCDSSCFTIEEVRVFVIIP